MKLFLSFILILFTGELMAQKSKEKKSYSYKKYEKLYLDELSTSISDGALGDLTLDTALKEKFKKSLPSRDDFKPEVIRSMRRIK